MTKKTGGCRKLTNGSKNYITREKQYNDLMNSGKYSNGYFSREGGGYYVIENSTATHKPEEIEAAKHLADNGYVVILKDEAGQIKTPDGYIFTAGFEQSTPRGGSVNNFKNCLEHARDKPGATAAVVYMKYASHTRETVQKGIEKYSEKNSKRLNVFVITKNGTIHRWVTHNGK